MVQLTIHTTSCNNDMYWRLDEMQLYIHSYFKLFILHVYFCNPHTKWLFQWLDLLFFCPKKLKQWKKRVLLKFLTCDIWYVYSRGIFFSLSYKRLTMFYIAKLCSDVGFFSLCSLEMALSRKLCQTLVYAQPHGKSLVLASNEKKNVNRLSLCTHATPIDI